ncbi:MAG: hypothetical protein P4K83_12430 [Terracidiphilus sp.]|nr:hypothetical protein [Terracidiphilus sp.]
MEKPLLYSRKRAALALSLSIRAVDYLLKNGKFKTVRIGKKNLIPAAELERLAASGLAGALAGGGE